MIEHQNKDKFEKFKNQLGLKIPNPVLIELLNRFPDDDIILLVDKCNKFTSSEILDSQNHLLHNFPYIVLSSQRIGVFTSLLQTHEVENGKTEFSFLGDYYEITAEDIKTILFEVSPSKREGQINVNSGALVIYMAPSKVSSFIDCFDRFVKLSDTKAIFEPSEEDINAIEEQSNKTKNVQIVTVSLAILLFAFIISYKNISYESYSGEDSGPSKIEQMNADRDRSIQTKAYLFCSENAPEMGREACMYKMQRLLKKND
jgi:hypothetical protein